MLILERGVKESIHIGDNIKITVTKIDGTSRVKLAIHAPQEMKVIRGEIENEPTSPKS